LTAVLRSRLPHSSIVSLILDPAAERDLTLKSSEVVAISTLLQDAKMAIATVQQRADALQAELRTACSDAAEAHETARHLSLQLERKSEEHAEVRLEATTLKQQLHHAQGECDLLRADMTEANQIRDHRAEARVEDLEHQLRTAEERASAAEIREWEAKASLTRVREALNDDALPG
jgi:chromosome segregation ATPase